MKQQGVLRGDRVWFYDARTPDRRMAVSAHPSDGVMVISLWSGDTCTGTFRLPTADAARLIAKLADGMAAGLSSPTAPPQAQPAASWRSRLLGLFRKRPPTGRHLRVVR